MNISVSNSSLSSNSFVFTVAPQGQPGNLPQILAFFPPVQPAGGTDFTMVVVGLNVAQNAVKLVSADANGKPIGGDFAAMEAAGTFMTFSTPGSASSPGTSEVYLTDPFF